MPYRHPLHNLSTILIETTKESVMSNIYRNDDLADVTRDPAAAPGLKSALIIRFKKFGNMGKRKYEYYFDDNELLVSPGNYTVEFSVSIGDAPKEIAKFRFFDYCSTYPIKVKNPTGFKTSTPINHASIPSRAEPVQLTIEPDNKELLLIGLIIEIRYKGETKSDYVLCDPQVGNGPPTGGGAPFVPAWTFSAE
jgi:hypothetical protein